MKKLCGISFLLGSITTLLVLYGLDRCTGKPVGNEYTPIIQEKTDTVVIRDTVRSPIPEPVRIQVVRVDTVHVSDTCYIGVPIDRIIYTTDNYKAIVEGYKPQLTEIEVYPLTTEITRTVTRLKPVRWALTVGPGVGYGPYGIEPHIGVSLGFVLWGK